MNQKSKKQLRQEAIVAEIKKREDERASRSPLNRKEMLSLIESVGKSIIDKGLDQEDDFKYTKQWSDSNSTRFDTLVSFLNQEQVKDDWGLAVSCDPFDLFGATSERLAWMPLEKEELEELLDWLDETLLQKGCAHNFDLAKSWLSLKSADTSTVLMALLSKGGGCDCEIVLNIETENIYPS